jgi:soluble epoxide hydrolase/lipid-phosphate phosphatase
LLGYGETDNPASPADYRGKKMAAEINELLKHLKLSKVHGVAHDWGTFLLSRLANYHPERLLSSSFLAVPYRPPRNYFDVDAVNSLTQKKLGYALCGYWKFFDKEDAAQVVKDHASNSALKR